MSSWLERKYAAILIAPANEDCPGNRCDPAMRPYVHVVERKVVLPIVEKYPAEQIDVGRSTKRLNVEVTGLPQGACFRRCDNLRTGVLQDLSQCVVASPEAEVEVSNSNRDDLVRKGPYG